MRYVDELSPMDEEWWNKARAALAGRSLSVPVFSTDGYWNQLNDWLRARMARDDATAQRFVDMGYRGKLVRHGLWADLTIEPSESGEPDPTIYEYVDEPSDPPWKDWQA